MGGLKELCAGSFPASAGWRGDMCLDSQPCWRTEGKWPSSGTLVRMDGAPRKLTQNKPPAWDCCSWESSFPSDLAYYLGVSCCFHPVHRILYCNLKQSFANSLLLPGRLEEYDRHQSQLVKCGATVCSCPNLIIPLEFESVHSPFRTKVQAYLCVIAIVLYLLITEKCNEDWERLPCDRESKSREVIHDIESKV